MVKRNFNKIPGFIRRFQPIAARELERVTEDAYDQMISSWEQGQTATGQSWEPLHPETVARKGHADPLIETGDMMDSAGYNVSRSNLTAEIYIADDKIAAHEFGLEHIPRRPVLEPTMKYIQRDIDNEVGKMIDLSLGGGSGGGLSVGTGAGY